MTTALDAALHVPCALWMLARACALWVWAELGERQAGTLMDGR